MLEVEVNFDPAYGWSNVDHDFSNANITKALGGGGTSSEKIEQRLQQKKQLFAEESPRY